MHRICTKYVRCTAYAPEVRTEYVFVAQHDGLVDFRLPEPARLLRREEDLHRDELVPPSALPHLAVPPAPHRLDQRDLLRDRPLDLQRRSIRFLTLPARLSEKSLTNNYLYADLSGRGFQPLQ